MAFVHNNSPAALAGLRFGDQILQINGENVAGWDTDKAMKFLKKALPQKITMAIRDRSALGFLRILKLKVTPCLHACFTCEATVADPVRYCNTFLLIVIVNCKFLKLVILKSLVQGTSVFMCTVSYQNGCREITSENKVQLPTDQGKKEEEELLWWVLLRMREIGWQRIG